MAHPALQATLTPQAKGVRIVKNKKDKLKIQYKILKQNTILIVIGIIMVLIALIPYLPKISIQINKLSMILNISPNLLKLLFVLLLFVVLTLLSYLPKIIKKTSINSHKLPPKKEMKKIFKLFQKYRISSYILTTELNYTKIKADHYIELLLNANYIMVYEPLLLHNIIIAYYILTKDLRYFITKEGNQYAVEHNLA